MNTKRLVSLRGQVYNNTQILKAVQNTDMLIPCSCVNLLDSENTIGQVYCMIELFLMITFKVNFDGWSLYPMIPLVIMGLGMIAISISRNARAVLARKLHF